MKTNRKGPIGRVARLHPSIHHRNETHPAANPRAGMKKVRTRNGAFQRLVDHALDFGSLCSGHLFLVQHLQMRTRESAHSIHIVNPSDSQLLCCFQCRLLQVIQKYRITLSVWEHRTFLLSPSLLFAIGWCSVYEQSFLRFYRFAHVQPNTVVQCVSLRVAPPSLQCDSNRSIRFVISHLSPSSSPRPANCP